MVLYYFVRRKRVSQINVLCTIYEKEHIVKYKVKAAAYCSFFPDHVFGNLTQSKQNLLV